MAKRRKIQSPMYDPNIEYVTQVSPQGDMPAENLQKHIKYTYWILFVILILLIFIILYAYLKGVPVKVR